MSFLLNHIAARVSIPTEDIATMGLCYILEESKTAKAALTKLVADEFDVAIEGEVVYETQSVGKDLTRPDMVTMDANDKEILLWEVKFWASLTGNQPTGYLARLKDNGGIGLVFICPKERRVSLFSELGKNSEYECGSNGNLLIKASEPPMLVLAWEEVINVLDTSIRDSRLNSDLDQLKQLVWEHGRQDFQPFSEMDLQPEMAKRILDYSNIVDSVAATLVSGGICSNEGLRTAASKGIYRNYLATENFGLSVAFDCYCWIKSEKQTSPFWLSIKKKTDKPKWESGIGYKKILESKGFKSIKSPIALYSDEALTPLYIEAGWHENVLVDEIVRQVKDIIGVLENDK